MWKLLGDVRENISFHVLKDYVIIVKVDFHKQKTESGNFSSPNTLEELFAPL